MFMLIVAVLNIIIFILLLPKIQELVHWFILVVVRIHILKPGVGYGDSLYLPQALDEKIASCLQSAPPLTYILLLSAASLVDEGFSTYVFRGGVLSREVEDIVTHFVVTWNDEASLSEAKYVIYGEGLITAIILLKG